MEPLPPCEHRRVELMASWQADMEARIWCKVCGADVLLTKEQVDEYDRLVTVDREEAAKYLVSFLPET